MSTCCSQAWCLQHGLGAQICHAADGICLCPCSSKRLKAVLSAPFPCLSFFVFLVSPAGGSWVHKVPHTFLFVQRKPKQVQAGRRGVLLPAGGGQLEAVLEEMPKWRVVHEVLQEIQTERARLQANDLPPDDSLNRLANRREVGQAQVLVVAQEVVTLAVPMDNLLQSVSRVKLAAKPQGWNEHCSTGCLSLKARLASATATHLAQYVLNVLWG